MKNNLLDSIEIEKIEPILKGFNESTGFVASIIDLDGNVLTHCGWRQICTEFHRLNPETAKKCLLNDTETASLNNSGEKFQFYKCLNGFIEVALPIVVDGEHIANLFSGQFVFEKPDKSYFLQQATKYRFNPDIYLKLLDEVPVVSEEKVKMIMEFLLSITQMICEMAMWRKSQIEFNLRISESEEKYRAMYLNTPLPYQSLDEKGCFVDVNPMWIKTLGYAKEDVIGKWFGDFLHPDYVDDFLVNFEAFKKRGFVSDIQFRLRKKDNSYIFVSYEGCVGYTPDGKFKQTYCVFKDITEKRELENALVQAKEMAEASEANQKKLSENLTKERILLRTLVESIPDAIYVKDVEGRKVLANQADCQNCGVENEADIIGKNDFDVFPAQLAEGFWEDDMKVVKEGVRIINREECVINADSSKKWLLTTKVPYFDYEGKIEGLIGIGHDFTNHKLAEDALVVKIDELERFHKLTVGRELTMIELKKEVNSLLRKLGEESKYKIVE